jgi:tRNA (guanine26-N2/guanine27-N2)-dimethyltransferase
LQNTLKDIIEITEGTTKILVPSGSVNETVPPREPAFFNPRAKLNRDFSVIAYSAFWKNFDGPKKFLDGLSGLGSRGLRVANEIKTA